MATFYRYSLIWSLNFKFCWTIETKPSAHSLLQLHVISLVRNIEIVYMYDTDQQASKSSKKKSAENLFGNITFTI